MNKVRKFAAQPFKLKLMLVEALLYLGWSRFLKALPFSKVAPTLGTHMEETSFLPNMEDEYAIRNISWAVQRMARHTWWESKCLVMAIAAMKMLRRRGIDSTLYLGTAKDAEGKMIAHAWLRSGPFYLTGAQEMNGFTEVARFGSYCASSRPESMQIEER